MLRNAHVKNADVNGRFSALFVSLSILVIMYFMYEENIFSVHKEDTNGKG
jgi:hypothetical protein